MRNFVRNFDRQGCMMLFFAGALWSLSMNQSRALGLQSGTASGELYRFVMAQAAPGKLSDLIHLYRERAPVISAGGDELPFIIRHSQGDRWDLLIIYPSGSFTEYYSPQRSSKRAVAAKASGLPQAQFAKKFYELVAWHEDVFVEGPPLASFRTHLKEAGLLHVEMMQALPGKRAALIEERKMENAFQRERRRPENLIFTHEQGAAWDVITIGAYRNWRHYAQSETVPSEISRRAAEKAGFQGPDTIGLYLRTLISVHHDTLGTAVPLSNR